MRRPLRGRFVVAWHPTSPGRRLLVWRPWWRRKRRPFASFAEVVRSYEKPLDLTRRRPPR